MLVPPSFYSLPAAGSRRVEKCYFELGRGHTTRIFVADAPCIQFLLIPPNQRCLYETPESRSTGSAFRPTFPILAVRSRFPETTATRRQNLEHIARLHCRLIATKKFVDTTVAADHAIAAHASRLAPLGA